MSIKLTILKTGETIISEMQELVEDQNQKAPNVYLLNNPHRVFTKDKEFLTEEENNKKQYGIDVMLTPWIILTSDKQILLPVDCVMTIVEPIESIKKMYIDKTDVKLEEDLNE